MLKSKHSILKKALSAYFPQILFSRERKGKERMSREEETYLCWERIDMFCIL